MSDTTTVPAGWYADPAGRRGQRWWDGFRWTAHVQPPPFEMSLAPVPAPVRRRNWGFGTADGDRADGRNTPAFHALILGLIGVVASPLLLPWIGALVYGAAAVTRAVRWSRAGHPATGVTMAAAGMVLGVFGLVAYFLP